MSSFIRVLCFCSILFQSSVTFGQLVDKDFDFNRFLRKLENAQREAAEARKARIDYIRDTQAMIRKDIENLKEELKNLDEVVPPLHPPKELPPFAETVRKRADKAFLSNLDKSIADHRTEIVRGEALSALLRVLGPIAHKRTLSLSRVPLGDNVGEGEITPSQATRYRLVPPTSGGRYVTVRPNRTPLDLEVPPVARIQCPADCSRIERLKVAFTDLLARSGAEDQAKVAEEQVKVYEAGETLTDAVRVLLARLVEVRARTVVDKSVAIDLRMKTFNELLAAVRYFERFHATADRLKHAPTEFKVAKFEGGTVEDFVADCYRRGYVFAEAMPNDEAAYISLFRQMQEYGLAVNGVEEHKKDIRLRMDELNATDRKLMRAALEKVE